MGCTIIGCGKALPALEVENDELAKLVDTNDEWIVTRTGISSRHVAVGETGTDLAETAARAALGWSQDGWCERVLAPEDIDLVIVATITPDALVPSAAGLLRERLGLEHAIAFDLNAACTGFIYGLTVAESMMAACAPGFPGAPGRNPVRRVLVVGDERLTHITDWADRSTCVLFGDGAGAAVMEWDEERPGILSSFVLNTTDDTGALSCPNAFDAHVPFDEEGVVPSALTAADRAPYITTPAASHASEGSAEALEASPLQAIYMDGQKVFKFAAEAMTEAIHQVLDRSGVALDDVACIVPHQANERIIKYAAKKLGRPMDLFQLSIANVGNTSAASVPMALADAYASGRIKPGDKVIVVAFGGGFTSGAVLFEA